MYVYNILNNNTYEIYLGYIYISLVPFLLSSGLQQMNSPQAQFEGAVDSYSLGCKRTRQTTAQSHLKPLLQSCPLTSHCLKHISWLKQSRGTRKYASLNRRREGFTFKACMWSFQNSNNTFFHKREKKEFLTS